jgi:hypothetical protein
MKRVMLHSNVMSLYVGLGERRKDDEILAATILRGLRRIIKMKMPGIDEILIPAFDYRGFGPSGQVSYKTETAMAFANMIISSNIRHSVIWDPIFRYLVLDADESVTVAEDKKEIEVVADYMPFKDLFGILEASDILAFTIDAFQPSLLMAVENVYFGNKHPYRKNKIFRMMVEGKEICYNYAVRSRNPEVCYRLVDLFDLLKRTAGKVYSFGDSIIGFQYGEFVRIIGDILENDKLGLLSDISSTAIRPHLLKGGLPNEAYT